MRDGLTRRFTRPEASRDERFARFQAAARAALVLVSGEASGSEFGVDRPRLTLGRGGDADLRFPDEAMSAEHAVLEFHDGAFRIRDLGSRNGTVVNGSEVKMAELKSGDRIQLGTHTFQLVVEERTRQPKTYDIPVD